MKPRASTVTTTEAAIRELVDQGLKFPEVAKRLGVNLTMLRQACSVLGIRSPSRVPFPRDAVELPVITVDIDAVHRKKPDALSQAIDNVQVRLLREAL